MCQWLKFLLVALHLLVHYCNRKYSVFLLILKSLLSYCQSAVKSHGCHSVQIEVGSFPTPRTG